MRRTDASDILYHIGDHSFPPYGTRSCVLVGVRTFSHTICSCRIRPSTEQAGSNREHTNHAVRFHIGDCGFGDNL